MATADGTDHGGSAALPRIELLGIPIHAVSEAACVDHILAELATGRGGWVVTPNLDHLRRLVREPGFRDLCLRATLRVADGMPLVWASWILGRPLPGRVAGSDLIVSLSAAAARHGASICLVGGNRGAAVGAACMLRQRFAGLDVRGTHCPEHGFETDPVRMQALGDALAAQAPEIVFVALGSPKQELVIDRLRAVLPSAWWLGVGISFSFLTGEVRRAPLWLQSLGLEWLHRLLQEPRRLAGRYLVQGLPFGVELLLRSAWQRLASVRRA